MAALARPARYPDAVGGTRGEAMTRAREHRWRDPSAPDLTPLVLAAAVARAEQGKEPIDRFVAPVDLMHALSDEQCARLVKVLTEPGCVPRALVLIDTKMIGSVDLTGNREGPLILARDARRPTVFDHILSGDIAPWNV